MRNRIALGAAGAAAAAILATGLVFATAGPSYPHSWCGPVLMQLHARETQGKFDANMSALEGQGAPVSQLIIDGDAATQDAAAANSSNEAAFSGGLAAIGDLDRASADLKRINQACRQPPSAYKNDNY